MAQHAKKRQPRSRSGSGGNSTRSRDNSGGERAALEAMRADTDAIASTGSTSAARSRTGPGRRTCCSTCRARSTHSLRARRPRRPRGPQGEGARPDKLNVGVDLTSAGSSGRQGVHAELVLKARLDHVSAIGSPDDDARSQPGVIEGLSKGISESARRGSAVDQTGEAAKETALARSRAQDVGGGAGKAAATSAGAGQAVGDVARALGSSGQPRPSGGRRRPDARADRPGGRRRGTGGQANGGPRRGSTGGVAKQWPRRSCGSSGSRGIEARELGMAATRKVRESGSAASIAGDEAHATEAPYARRRARHRPRRGRGHGQRGSDHRQRRPGGARGVTRREPDVEIAATVRADELRFECKPEVVVHAPESVSARENLPDEVEPGVTYRDIAVSWRVAARLSTRLLIEFRAWTYAPSNPASTRGRSHRHRRCSTTPVGLPSARVAWGIGGASCCAITGPPSASSIATAAPSTGSSGRASWRASPSRSRPAAIRHRRGPSSSTSPASSPPGPARWSADCVPRASRIAATPTTSTSSSGSSPATRPPRPAWVALSHARLRRADAPVYLDRPTRTTCRTTELGFGTRCAASHAARHVVHEKP